MGGRPTMVVTYTGFVRIVTAVTCTSGYNSASE